MSRLVISDALDVAVNTKSVVNLKISILSEIESSTGRDLIQLNPDCWFSHFY